MQTSPAPYDDGIDSTVPVRTLSIGKTIDTQSVEQTSYVEVDFDICATESAVSEPKDSTDDPAALALALAATRAEVARLQRELDDSHRAIRLRDGWLKTAQSELKASEEERRALAAALQDAQQRIDDMSKIITTLQIDLDALRATEPFSGEYQQPVEIDPENPPRLEPLGHDGPVVILDRKVLTVGRTAECDVCVPSPLVSRDHARLLVSGNAVTIVDVGSVNGCFVNQRQVKKQVLRDGDVLRIADRAFRVSLSAA